MESQEIIDYKWQNAVYSLDYMINLVKENILTKEEFFEITRFNYDGLLKSQQKK